MYANCMFCSRPLGENQVVEHFPVGRRLAFDSERGRLWVVCKKCERWNLTPIEERWEAVEACERLFRSTRLRASTENIGLARHLEGLELVRIGRPLRPEFAAWRYGDQFGRRRTRAILYGAGAAAVLGGISIGGVIVGGAGANLWLFWNAWYSGRTLVKLRTDEGRVIKLKEQDLKGTRLRANGDGDGYLLEVRKGRKRFSFEGKEAEHHLARIIPKINRMGGKKDTIQEAVASIEEAGHPDAFLAQISSGRQFVDRKGIPGYLNKMPAPTKLALEMALHEEQERRALAGELWLLAEAWREAEEIAAISDNLLLPEGAEEFIEKHRPGPNEDGEETRP